MAQLAITALLLALVRTLGQYFWLRHVRGPGLKLGTVTPYITGGLISAVGTLVAILLYFFERFRLAAVVVGLAVLVLLTYKVVVFGPSP